MANNRGLLGDSWAFTEALGEGVWDAGTGMVKGLGDLAKGGYELATEANARESAWETTKELADAAADYSKSVIENPGEAYRYARDGTLAAYDRFEQAKDLAAAEGRSAEFFGDMAGGALFEVGSILVPVGLVAKAGKLGKVASVADDVADAAKTAKKVENAEEVFGATQKAKAASVNPVIKEFDDKISPIQRCPVADSDVGVKNVGKLSQKDIDLSKATGTTAKHIAARKKLATDFYEKQGMPKSKIEGHTAGIDFNKPVEVIELPKDKVLHQYQVPNGPQGNYYTEPGVKPSSVGISSKAKDWNTGEIVERQVNTYKATNNVKVLQSSAKNIDDTWSIPGKTIPTDGGGAQYFTMNNSSISGK